MDIEQIRLYLLAKPHVTEGLPFGPSGLVFKIGGKMFAIVSLDDPDGTRINLKCDPERAVALRERHVAIRPGYHMNKRHWNSLYLGEEDFREALLHELMDHSYDLVVASLTKRLRTELGLKA